MIASEQHGAWFLQLHESMTGAELHVIGPFLGLPRLRFQDYEVAQHGRSFQHRTRLTWEAATPQGQVLFTTEHQATTRRPQVTEDSDLQEAREGLVGELRVVQRSIDPSLLDAERPAAGLQVQLANALGAVLPPQVLPSAGEEPAADAATTPPPPSADETLRNLIGEAAASDAVTAGRPALRAIDGGERPLGE